MNNMKRNNLISFFGVLLLIYMVFVSSCSPSLGASWYAKSGGKSAGVQMCITSIKVAEKVVEVNDPEYRAVADELPFTKAKRFAITVPFSVKNIDIGSIQIEAYENAKKVTPVKVNCEIEGDSVPLSPGEAVSIVLRIKDDTGRFRVEEKFISVTREAPQAVDLVMQKLEVFGNEVVWDEGSKSGTTQVQYSKGASVTAGDIKATFKVGNEERVLPVVVENTEVELKVGEAVQVSCSVEEKKWEYNSYSFTLNCTRLEKQEGEEEPLTLKYLSVCNIDARSGLVKVGQDVAQITKENVVAIFETFGTLPVKLQKDIVNFDSAGAAELEITVEGKKGEYSEWKRTVHVLKEGSNDPSNPDDNDNSENPKEPEQELPQLKNPKDENGNEKFIVKLKVTEEEIDPFDWFKENAGGFSASEFDGWILNMTAITSDNVASYSFLPGTWEGSNPPTCTGETIGEGQLNKTWNLKYYKYGSQADRWEGRYTPSLSDVEKKRRERFLFFRFTGDAAMGTHLDNSMFCVDTVTKFLFFYSAPRDISGFGVPSNWRDYEEETEGSHIHSDVPFYLTDPVGYVEKDGKCVIYGWCKQNIRQNKYIPSINQSFRKVATRRAGGFGHSPYKNKIKKVTKERIVEANPDYSAEKPFIISQSGSLYLTLEDTEEAVVSVKVKDAPEKEELSYQWYKNKLNQEDGAIAIDGATVSSYKFEKKEMDVFCWCIITNKNTENQKTAKTTSQAVKVRIAKSAEDLKVDAETPVIMEHPKSSKHSFIQGKSVDVTLAIKVKKPSDKGILSYQWFESSQDKTEEGTKIEGATETTYKASITDAGIKYYYCEVTNKNEKATGEKSVSIVSAIARVEVEELYELDVNCVGEGTLTVFGSEDARKVVVDKDHPKTVKVKIGSELVFIAKEKQGWEIEKWEGVSASKDEKTAQLEVKNKSDVEKAVEITFAKILKKGLLSIRSARIENISIDTPKYDIFRPAADCAYFYWQCLADIEDDKGKSNSASIFSDEYKRKGHYLYVQNSPNSPISMTSDRSTDFPVLLEHSNAKLTLDVDIKKCCRYSSVSSMYYFDICKTGESTIEFKYDENSDSWKIDKVNVKKDIDNGQEVEYVKVEFDETFVLRRRVEKDFVVTYKINNPNEKTVGDIKLTYTLSWGD